MEKGMFVDRCDGSATHTTNGTGDEQSFYMESIVKCIRAMI